MAEIRIRFISDGDFTDGVIEWFEGGSQWSHTEIILPDGTYLGARQKGGVAIRPADYCKPVRERRYAVPVTDEQHDKIMAFANSQIGKDYDMSTIYGIALHKNWNNKDKWICSEFVGACFEAGGVYLLNVEHDFAFKITPEMLHLSPLLIGHCYYKVIDKA